MGGVRKRRCGRKGSGPLPGSLARASGDSCAWAWYNNSVYVANGQTQDETEHTMAKRLLQALALICLLLMPHIAYAEAMPDHGIPVLCISVDGGQDEFVRMNTSEGHAYECTGSLSLAVPEGYVDTIGLTTPQSLANLEVEYLRGRGNSTWNPDGGRNPYKVKLRKKAALLGPNAGASKHWVLLASPYDSSGMRNRLVALMGTRLGLAYTPVGTHVDLVINDEYRGSYYLCEQVRVGDSRVGIDELGPTDVEEPAITGGYLLAMAPDADEPAGNRITTSRGVSFCGDSPSFASSDPNDELGAPEQKAYLATYLQTVEDAIWEGGPWDSYMDADSAAAYWWVQEFVQNVDAYLTPSTYLYKERSGKLYWGPLWDFDQSMGCISAGTEGLTFREMDWLDFLRTYDEGFIQRLREVWSSYDATLEDIVREGGVLDQLAGEVRASWQADFELWVQGTPREPYARSFDGEVEDIRSWITARRSWINEHVGTGLDGVFSAVSFEVDGQTVAVRHARTGSYFSSLAGAPHKDGMVFLGWHDQDGTLVEGGVELEGDLTLTAQYAPIGETVLAQDIFFSSYDFWTALDAPDGPPYVIVTAESQERYPQWTSSDPSVAEADAHGFVIAHAAGTTTITATLANGTSKSYTLHVVQASSELYATMETLTPRAESLELNVGAYGQVPVDVGPQANSSTFPVYECADPSVAEVDELGVVRAIAAGTTEIRACDPNDPEATFATFAVIVNAAEEEEPGGNGPGDGSGDKDGSGNEGSEEEPEEGSGEKDDSEDEGEETGNGSEDEGEPGDEDEQGNESGDSSGEKDEPSAEKPSGDATPATDKPGQPQSGGQSQERSMRSSATFGTTAASGSTASVPSRQTTSATLARTADASLVGSGLCAACGLLAVIVGHASSRRWARR